MTDEPSSAGTAYPKRFEARYTQIECLSAADRGETLLVSGRDDDGYCVAKLTREDGLSEETLLQSLSHPGLPRYVECFREEGFLVSVREYVEGTPLDDYMRARPLVLEQMIDIAIQLCDVLTYLHTQSPPVIHRDVKPQNVIVTNDAKAVLIDFGIARVWKPAAKRDTVFSGTNDFAPPEQYGFAQTDARADIYSLGMLLRYLLTGGDLEAQIEDRRLRRIVARCTAFSPEHRYQTADAVKRALERLNSKAPQYMALVLTAVLALTAGFFLGRYLPTLETCWAERAALQESQSPEEYARAEALGIIPADLAAADLDTQTVTWKQYCTMLGTMLTAYDDSLLADWTAMTGNAPDTQMNRDGGMLALLFAGELMGIDSFNAQPPAPFSTYAPRVWETATMDYPVFEWNRYKKIDEGCWDNNYVGPAYDYSVRRISHVSGKTLLEFDIAGDLRLEQPLTMGEAVLSVLRLYESTEKTTK